MMTNIESNLHICKYIEPGGRGSCARVWSYSKNALFHKAGQEGVGVYISLMTYIILIAIVHVLRGYNVTFLCHF